VEVHMHNRWEWPQGASVQPEALGFVGSHLVDALLKLGSEVTVFDNLSTGFHDFVNSDAKMELGDCRDILALKEVVAGQEFVFHLARMPMFVEICKLLGRYGK